MPSRRSARSPATRPGAAEARARCASSPNGCWTAARKTRGENERWRYGPGDTGAVLGFRQDGAGGVRIRAFRTRHRAGGQRRHRAGALRCRARGERRLRSHRLPRDDGWAGSRRSTRPSTAASSPGAMSPPTARRWRRTVSPPSTWLSSTSTRSRRGGTVAGGADRDEAVEQIDIGGPRADPRRGQEPTNSSSSPPTPKTTGGILRELAENDGRTTLDFRKCLAAAAYARTASYDAAISQWFAREVDIPFPRHIAFGGNRVEALRYGENPHQEAAFYRALPERPGAASATPIQGRALSYNNLGDADAAFELVAEFDRPAIAIIKHANPCGAAGRGHACRRLCECPRLRSGKRFRRGGRRQPHHRRDSRGRDDRNFRRGDRRARHRRGSARGVREKAQYPRAGDGVMPDTAAPGLAIRSIAGGLLVQDRDAARPDAAELNVVTKRRADGPGNAATSSSPLRSPSTSSRTRSSSPGTGATVGIGAGQMSRVGLDPNRGPQGRRHRARSRPGRAGHKGLGGRFGRVPAVRRRADRRGGGGRDRDDPAGRLDPRRRSDRRRRRARHRDGVHRHAAFSATEPARF